MRRRPFTALLGTAALALTACGTTSGAGEPGRGASEGAPAPAAQDCGPYPQTPSGAVASAGVRTEPIDTAVAQAWRPPPSLVFEMQAPVVRGHVVELAGVLRNTG